MTDNQGPEYVRMTKHIRNKTSQQIDETQAKLKKYKGSQRTTRYELP